jgi:putative ABC transport system permease protein
MEQLLLDFRHAVRRLRKSPVFALTAVVTLALGIGANAAVFSVFNAVILEPVSFPEPETLVQLVNTANGEPIDSGASLPAYEHWREQTDVIESVTAYRNVSLNYTSGDTPERVAAIRVTGPYFDTFRAPMALGRPFTAEEELLGATSTVVSYAFWTQRLGGDPALIGRSLSLNGVPYTVVGVTAPEFDTRDVGEVDLWVPFTADAGAVSVKAAARLKAGVSLAQAQARLAASTDAFRERVTTALRDEVRFGAVLFKDAVIATGSSTLFRNDPRGLLGMLFGAVAFVLLIACANVASLMLGQASARERDLAVRVALGAGRWRIVRQLLTESAIICAIGGALGLAIGLAGIRALLAVNSAGLPRLGEAGASLPLDWRVAAFTVSVSAATVMLCGLLPALAASRADPNSSLKYSSHSSTTGFKKNKSRSAIVMAQISLAIVLLIGAALLIRTTFALNAVDPGFNVDDVVAMRTFLPEERFQTATAVRELSTSTLERLRAVPGVEAATASCCVPLQRSWGATFKIIGRDDAGRPFSGGGDITISTGDYFDVLEIPVVRGRVFNERDDAGAQPVIVINRALADRWWPGGQGPLGERLQIAVGDEPPREVVGIVENERKARLDIVRPIMYVPLAQVSDSWLKVVLDGDSLAWIVRTSNDPMPLSAVIRDQIQQRTGVAVTDIAPMREIMSGSIARQRANTLLMSVFGGVALLLAAIGIYGVIAYSVQQRTHELGIRMALGARRDRILGMVVRQGAVLVLLGTVVGLTAAYFLAGLLSSMLFGVEPRSVAVFVGAPVTLAVAALVAIAIPAYRASRVQPLSALRSE